MQVDEQEREYFYHEEPAVSKANNTPKKVDEKPQYKLAVITVKEPVIQPQKPEEPKQEVKQEPKVEESKPIDSEPQVKQEEKTEQKPAEPKADAKKDEFEYEPIWKPAEADTHVKPEHMPEEKSEKAEN